MGVRGSSTWSWAAMPGSEAFLGDGVLSAVSSLPMSGVQRRPAMICKFIAVGASCGARGDDGGGLARGGPHGLVPAMDAAACCEDCREKDGDGPSGGGRHHVLLDHFHDMPTDWNLRSTRRQQVLLLHMQHGAPCSVMCFLARSGAAIARPCQYVCEHEAQGMDGNIGALLVLIPLHIFSQDVFKPAKISIDGIILFTHKDMQSGAVQKAQSSTSIPRGRLCWWRPCAPGSVSTSSSYEIHCYSSGCHTLYPVQVAVYDEYAFLLFGTCRRRVRACLLRFLRFNSQEPPGLSSVMAHLDLQLIPLPHRHLPT